MGLYSGFPGEMVEITDSPELAGRKHYSGTSGTRGWVVGEEVVVGAGKERWHSRDRHQSESWKEEEEKTPEEYSDKLVEEYSFMIPMRLISVPLVRASTFWLIMPSP